MLVLQPPAPDSNSDQDAPLILLTHEYAPFRGGVATYVREIAAAAARSDVPVEVWTVDYVGRRLEGDKKTEDHEKVPRGTKSLTTGFPLVRVRSNGRLTPRGLLNLAWGLWRRRRSLSGKPVALMSVGAQMAFFLLDLVGVRIGGEIVCFFHGSEVPRFQKNPFWRWLARRSYRRADAFAATTRYVADLLRNSGLLPVGSEITLVPCALPETFQQGAVAGEDHVSTKLPLKAEDRDLRVLTVARLHPRKGQWEVAQALARLPEDLRKRVVYQLVGVGDAAYRRKVAEACEAGRVRCEFLGGLDDAALGTIYRQASVYVQASRTLAQSVEGFGITFLEASAYGCPVAAWWSGGVAEAVQHGQTGLLSKEGDIAGLAADINKLLADPAMRARLGGQGKDFARTFRWETSAHALWQLSKSKHV